ncbi:MAG: TetR/AcrR family fatty acid metabolism transcriptional regulator [Bradymonadia bacterium]
MGTIVSRERTTDKRERILQAALTVFAKRGFYTAKVSEVAREAGVADGTIYLYFKNKDDLLIQLFEDRMDFLIQRLNEELVKHGGTVVARIRRLILLHLQIASIAPELAEFITVELRQSSKFVREYDNPKFSEYLKVLRDLVEEGQRDGSIRQDLDSRLVVRTLFGALDELLLTATLLSKTREVDYDAMAEMAAGLLLNGLAQS